MVRFHETNLGRKHYERDFPALVAELREFTGTMQQLLSLQQQIFDVANRALVKSMSDDLDDRKIIKFEWRFGNADINTSYFSTVEEFMKFIGDRSGEDFISEIHFSKWMLQTNFRYESTVYYAP